MDDHTTVPETIALVTGSSQGIGFGIARGLAEAGATVILNGRRRESLEAAQSRLAEDGLSVDLALFDVTDSAAVESAIEDIESGIGPIDVLVNNAGGAQREPFLTMTRDAWNHILELNLTGAFTVSQIVARRMATRKRGKIINICSLMSSVARENNANYAASKGGLAMLTRSMAVELGRYNIQVNGIGPGYVETPLTQPLREDPEFDAWFKKHTPLGRWARVDEIAGPAVFLASSRSDYITGQILYVDGGFLASM